MRDLTIALILLTSAVVVFSGSECPERAKIYPCTCIYIHHGKKNFHTLLVCNGIKDKEELSSILLHFNGLTIDKFFMYDSYWGANLLEDQKTLPKQLFTLPLKEVEVVDSKIASCFACEWDSCDNTDLIKLKVRNSTSAEQFCSFCDNEDRLPWMTCTQSMQHLESSYGNINKMSIDFFPTLLVNLKTLDLSHNKITKVDEGVFRNVPHLQRIDLSYNKIEKIDRMFTARTEVEFLDLSHNELIILGSSLIPGLPKAKILSLAYNKIVDLKLTDWRRISKNVTRIDLSKNLINCECNLKWVNHTFSVSTVIEGNCATPEVYKNTRIRRASIYLNERCDANNTIGARRRL